MRTCLGQEGIYQLLPGPRWGCSGVGAAYLGSLGWLRPCCPEQEMLL